MIFDQVPFDSEIGSRNELQRFAGKETIILFN